MGGIDRIGTEMRANSLLVSCVLLLGCRRGTLSADAGAGVIGMPGRDGATGETTSGDAGTARTVWSAWPLPNHDPANTRRSPNVGPQAPVDRFVLDVVPEQLVIGGDGTLYATDGGDAHPIAALNPATGARLWTFTPTPTLPTTVPPYSPSIAVGARKATSTSLISRAASTPSNRTGRSAGNSRPASRAVRAT